MSKNPKVLISGEGRSGTTLLVKFFNLLGFDTGGGINGPHEWTRGKEISPQKIDSKFQMPEVIKNPGGFVVNLKRWVEENNWNPQHLFYMTSTLEVAINKRLYAGPESRVKISPRHFNLSQEEYSRLSDEQKVELLETALQRRIGLAVYGAFELGIPVTVVNYQEFCYDIEYARQVLQPVLKLHNLTVEDVCRVHSELIDLNKVKPWFRVSDKVMQ